MMFTLGFYLKLYIPVWSNSQISPTERYTRQYRARVFRVRSVSYDSSQRRVYIPRYWLKRTSSVRPKGKLARLPFQGAPRLPRVSLSQWHLEFYFCLGIGKPLGCVRGVTHLA